MSDYQQFLDSKRAVVPAVGVTIDRAQLHPRLFPFQRDIVHWALLKGRCAIFADTGLGKTGMQLEWARHAAERVLIVAPLSVARQTVREAREKWDLQVTYARHQAEAAATGITITNYEMVQHFDAAQFGAVVLDESSILKNLSGVLRNQLVSQFRTVPLKLACTATPAPNDIMELSNHADFLNVASPQQVTAQFFVHEAGVFQGVKESRWRLKGHAEAAFYRWLSSWSIAVKRPSDLGYSDDGYTLPPLTVDLTTVESDYVPEGRLFFSGGISATDARHLRKQTLSARVARIAELVNNSAEQFVIWAGLNDEATALAGCIPGAVNVEGSMAPDAKAEQLEAFQDGRTRVLVTKTSIAGFGMNMQQAHRMVFCGLDFSWESYYQAIRRMYRFGQTDPVQVDIVISEQERSIFDVIVQKEQSAIQMTDSLIAASRDFMKAELAETTDVNYIVRQDEAVGQRWRLLLGDSCQRMSEIESASVDLSVYSPPFSDMYIYSNTEADLSNSRDLDEFFAHYAYIIRENLRITKPGRLAVVHVQDPKIFKNRAGFRGLLDFPGDVVRAYQSEGWIYRARITIDKNPQIVASRNKDNDLLFVTGQRDSSNLAPMATDYLLVFKAPGDNLVPITPYTNGEMTEEEWIAWAHAVWYDIRETDVLNMAVAKDNADEKHVCPLQLPIIDRCIKLWSNPGELVFTPFGGIGSELYQALLLGRRALGIELKESYWRQAIRNCEDAERRSSTQTLFDFAGIGLNEKAGR